MDIEILKNIIGDFDLTDENLSVLLTRAQKKAVAQHYWHADDIPTEEELVSFYDRYEYEIYDIAKAMHNTMLRGDIVSHTELGITDRWASSESTVNAALSAIPARTYVV